VTPAVFLDRDGTLIEDHHYLASTADVTLFPWTIEALRLLSTSGFALVVVTNQSGVARGFFDESSVRRIHEHLAGLLDAHGVRVDGYYYCPHHPDARVEAYRRDCECRKPRPGMVHAAARDLGLDVGGSYMVGDLWRDIALAQHAGASGGVLVRTGQGAEAERARPAGLEAAAVVDTLLDAARWIVACGRPAAPSRT
jgi:D-glycero-D-manno-heptose 1,7-bisphosphate phosphatase